MDIKILFMNYNIFTMKLQYITFIFLKNDSLYLKINIKIISVEK